MTSPLKKFYRNNPWQARILTTLLFISLLVIVVRLALSPAIIYGTNTWLKSQGINSTIEDFTIDLFAGSVSLINAEGLRNNTPLFKIGRIEIHWQWQPLSNKTIHISSIALDRISINIKHYADNITIGGVSIPLDSKPPSAAKTDAEQPALLWAANLGEVVISNLNICYLQHNTTELKKTDNTLAFDYCLTLDNMSWQGNIAYASDTMQTEVEDIPLSTSGDFTLSGLTVTDNRLGKSLLASKTTSLKDVHTSGLNNIHIKQLKMERLSLLQRDEKQHIDAIRFKQLMLDDITLTRLNTLKINTIALQNPGVYLVKLDTDNWEYQQWLPATLTSGNNEPTDKTITHKPDTENTSGFDINIKTVNITASDLCYLEHDSALYYCLTLASLHWRGPLSYSTRPLADKEYNLQLNGELELQSFNIKNHSLSRDLIDINKLVLSELALDGLDNISLAQLDIEKLRALQRGSDTRDNTATFDALVISDIKHSKDSLSINTIQLSGLYSALSKNKNGEWEHDKWQHENKTGNTTTKPATEQKPAEKSPQLNFSLNSLEVNTDKKLLFTDNSTTPAMNIGLQTLDFSIKNLYSAKPDSNSLFSLFARTIRHGTIDIAGTIKPFAKKISFDANGKLTGFDLRAATPATKKAIGHIIQSGQMDADLTLKASDGILDSNIDLSLYQFKIKSTSKKEADKLDKKLGMPLNQTLLLLRDKDDSIHLSIPVTGDIENPQFNPMDAIITATTKAAAVTLITFYTPYGLVYAGGNLAYNLATALNFDPITFTAGSAELLEQNKQQLDNLAKLMSEKPQVHLTLCGITNQSDAVKLFPELNRKKTTTQNKNDHDEPAEITLTLNGEQNSKLAELARQRQMNTKNYMITAHEIKHDRLILCAPEHKTGADAIAGVEIHI